ncbi:MAG: glycosyltransferase family 39 protein [Bacteroidota bacterium]
MNSAANPNRRLITIILLFTVVTTWIWGTNNLSLFDWDELNFAEIGREMKESGNFLQPQINYQAFHEKPPLFAWMQLASFQLWGIGSLGARFPNILCGLFSVLVLWWQGRRWFSDRFGWWWAAFMAGSILPALYFRSGIIDPWFNLFILLGLLPALAGKPLSLRQIFICGLWLGLAVLTKGPAAGLIAGLCWIGLLVWEPSSRWQRSLQYFSTGLLALIPIAVWLYFLWQVDNGFFASEFLQYQWRLFIREDAGHGGFPGYHFVVLLIGCFPAALFALPRLLRSKGEPSAQDRGMRILFWVVLLLFSIVNTKIVHYSSLCYFPLAYFAARWVTEGETSLSSARWLRVGGAGIWGLYGLASLLLPLTAWNLGKLRPYLQEEELLSRLALDVNWPWYCLLPFVLLLLGGVVLSQFRHRALHLRAGAHLLLAFGFITASLPVFAPIKPVGIRLMIGRT